jgi:predicted metalloprotease with PDZ domain
MMSRILALLLALPVVAQEAAPRLSVAYEVDVSDPGAGKAKIRMTVSQNTADEVKLAMPAWAPGAYRIVKYARAVWNLEATAKGGKLEVANVDEQTWSVRAGRAPVFEVAYDLTIERPRLNPDHCYLAGPDTYLYIVDRKDAPCRVRFRLPEGWRVGTGLEPDGDGFKARDYDTFIDCPTELGKFELVEFAEDGAKYQLVIHAKGPVDGQKLATMCRRIVKDQNKMFGGKPPFDRYVFLYHFQDQIGGSGLEHLNSTNISMPYAAVRAEPHLAASVTSHEYFHLWNVKRIRPFELGPFDYSQPVRSKALWMCEGVTSYFGDRTLARTGIWSEEQYFRHLGGEVETLQNNPDRLVTSVEKASQVVWDRKDWPRVDYYNKGELLGLLIDLKMRTASGGRKTLDDVMRLLNQTYVLDAARAGKGEIGVGYPEDGILKALNEVSGQDWSDFLARHVAGVEELPFEPVLEAAGLDVDLVVTRSPDLGVELRSTTVVGVPAGGAAEKAGVKAADRVLTVNGVEVTRTNLRDELGKLKPGEPARLRLGRGTDVVEATVPVTERQRTTCKVRRAPEPAPAQKRLLDAWLARPTEY